MKENRSSKKTKLTSSIPISPTKTITFSPMQNANNTTNIDTNIDTNIPTTTINNLNDNVKNRKSPEELQNGLIESTAALVMSPNAVTKDPITVTSTSPTPISPIHSPTTTSPTQQTQPQDKKQQKHKQQNQMRENNASPKSPEKVESPARVGSPRTKQQHELLPMQGPTSKRLKTVITPIMEKITDKARLKHQPVSSVEELHQAFYLAEVASPGITDLFVSHMISKLKYT